MHDDITLVANTLDDFPNRNDPLVVLLPLLIVLSTLLFLLLLFLICVLIIRRRRAIVLRDNDGPVDLSREDLIDGDGGFEGVESRWLETVSEVERATYRRAQAWQLQYPPNSLPTDITLSQFLSIQEKGVSAWSFEPDYESSPNVLVHARTELTFLPDPSSASAVQSNLPLPKLNEVYYWEVKMFDLPAGTNVSIGLATKPYPTFRLPGHNRHSIAYHSNGDKSYNYPFTAHTYGSPLKEGDVLGVGYRPRTGAVFFTRNGRKMEDAFVGLNRWNLFPTVGADGPCSVHVNLGQAGFVHIEANVKKWGLAPSVGTLAPPPAYGSERGSILLEAGGASATAPGAAAATVVPSPLARVAGRVRNAPPVDAGATSGQSTPARRSTRGSRRPKRPAVLSTSVPSTSSPLRGEPMSPPSNDTHSDQQPLLPSDRYISPTDAEYHESAADPRLPPPSPSDSDDSRPSSPSTRASSSRRARVVEDTEATPLVHVADESEDVPANPPTPNVSDIHLRPLNSHSRGSSIHTATSFSRRTANASGGSHSRSNSTPVHPSTLPAHLRPPTDTAPPAYSPLDAFAYPDGVAIDLPDDVIAAALSGGPASSSTPTPAPQR